MDASAVASGRAAAAARGRGESPSGAPRAASSPAAEPKWLRPGVKWFLHAAANTVSTQTNGMTLKGKKLKLRDYIGKT